MLPQQLQSNPKMLLVLLLRLRINENVVDEYYNELVQVRSENPIHHIHEECWCVRQSEWHDYELNVSIASLEGCIRDVLLLHK